MKNKIVLILLGILFTSIITISAETTSQIVRVDKDPEIIIDGNMTDWGNIPNIVNDSKTDVPGMNLIGAQVVNDTDFLFIRMIYAGAYEYPLLWGNVTLRNSAEDVFVLMAFVSTDFTQQDTWIFPGTDIDNPRNDPSQPETYTQYLNYSAVSLDYTSIEFKIPLADIDSGNPANLADIDLVFWHFDAFQASLRLSMALDNDRAPDTGFATYYPALGPGEIDDIDTSTTLPPDTVTLIPEEPSFVPLSILWFAGILIFPILKKFKR